MFIKNDVLYRIRKKLEFSKIFISEFKDLLTYDVFDMIINTYDNITSNNIIENIICKREQISEDEYKINTFEKRKIDKSKKLESDVNLMPHICTNRSSFTTTINNMVE